MRLIVKGVRLVGFACLLTTNVPAVGQGRLSLSDVTSGTFRAEVAAAGAVALDDGETFAELSADRKRVVRRSFRTGNEVEPLFDAATARGAELTRIDNFTVSPDGRRMLLQTRTRAIYRHSLTADYYVYTLSNRRLQPLSDEGQEQAPIFSPDGQEVAFVRDGNIFLARLLYDGAVVQLTRDGHRGEVLNGVPDWVNEEEFSTARAMTFTPDGRQLVWVRYDEREVPAYQLTFYKGLAPERKENAVYPGTESYKYPVAGERNSSVSLWSYDLGSRQTRRLQVPLDDDGYVPRIAAAGEGGLVAVFTLNRRQDCLRIYLTDALSTVSHLLTEERAESYVREETVSNAQLTSRHLLLPSDRTGWMHLYLYNLNGQLVKQIDDGDYEVSDVYGYDEATGSTYFASHESAGATDQRVWVAPARGARQLLTPKAGWNSAVFGRGYRYFINTWSDLNTPPVTTLRDTKGRELAILEDNQSLRSRMADYGLGTRELFTLTTADGTTLNGWMVKPANFDAQRQYPVVMYQYGGPGSQQVANRWSVGMAGQGALLEQYLAQLGFVVVCVDGRGTGGRGARFEKCTYQRLGQLEASDQVEAALWLGRQSWVDAGRIGIWGWSFGGFNTLMAMSEGRPAFRCGIAIAPPTSWRFYDTIYTERYMRTPKENPEGYDVNPISRASQLSGALLLCHGLADDNVHFRNTAEYTEALVQADKDFRQLVYTNRNHSIRGGNTRQHLFRQCVNFFKRELQPVAE